MKQHKPNHKLSHSIVFYDHACGICRYEMRKLKKHDYLDRLQLIDISSAQFDPGCWGISANEVNQQLHVLTPARLWLTGISAVRHIYAEAGLGWLWWSTQLPGISFLSQRAYNWFAHNRIRISKNLGMYSQFTSCESCQVRTNKNGGIP